MTNEEIQKLLDSANAENSKGNNEEGERLANIVLNGVEKDSEFYISALIALSGSFNLQGKFEMSLNRALEAFDLAERQSFQLCKARACNAIGNVYFRLSSYDKAIEYYGKALVYFEELGDKLRVADATINIGNIYNRLNSNNLALEYYGKALAIYELLDYKYGVALATGNIGVVYSVLGDNKLALEYFFKALAINEEQGLKSSEAKIMSSIATTYSELGDYDLGLKFYNKALVIVEELGEKAVCAIVMSNIGGVYSIQKFEDYSPVKSEEYLLRALAISNEIGTKKINLDIFKNIALLYEQTGRLQEAIDYLKKYHDLEKEVQSEEAKKKAEQFDHQRKIELQEKEMAIKKAAMDAKHEATQSLLHKVMPDTIAKRMIEGETEIADYYPAVSILFADIEGFTPMSADMPAYIVVRFLNTVFREFDQIMKRHGCEKIKTIGDGYMAVAGAPVACEDHAERIANAALEMRNAIEIPEDIKVFMPEGAALNIRIGIHTGSVVAGVVGEDRFVYDIYSDAVNTAARMESHGESGKIHVSSDFMRHLLNRFAQTKVVDHGIMFVKREEMEVKGKGRMKTFFLEKE